MGRGEEEEEGESEMTREERREGGCRGRSRKQMTKMIIVNAQLFFFLRNFFCGKLCVSFSFCGWLYGVDDEVLHSLLAADGDG